MLKKTLAGLALGTALVAAGQANAQARDQIQIVGSSTVFPYTQAVVEQFSGSGNFAAPVLESTGTGGGMQIFCGGVGAEFPDITGASRAMTESEWELCKQNGVDNVTEVLIGYDALSLANAQSGPELNVTKAQLFQALAAQVEVDGEIVANPYQNWNDIDASLPAEPILVYGPPTTSGTRDAFIELVMEEGCETFPAIAALGDDQKEEVCQIIRSDGPFVEAGENDNLIVQRLESDPKAFGIFGYSFLFENLDRLKGASIEGAAPSEETVASGEYSVSRPLFFYVKNAHRDVILGLQEFIEAYVSEDAAGPDGYLVDRGLVPLSDEEFAETSQAAIDGTAMEAPAN